MTFGHEHLDAYRIGHGGGDTDSDADSDPEEKRIRV